MRRAILFLALASAATPAAADWNYTRWGMSPDEVLAANPALRADVDEYHSIRASLVRVSGTHREDGRDYVVRFGFDAENRLNTVYVEPTNARDCRRVLAAIEARVGQGDRNGVPDLLDSRVWQDRRAGNMINSIVIGRLRAPGSCTVRYHPPEGPGDPPPPPGKEAANPDTI